MGQKMLSENGAMKQDWPRELEVKILDLNISIMLDKNLFKKHAHVFDHFFL